MRIVLHLQGKPRVPICGSRAKTPLLVEVRRHATCKKCRKRLTVDQLCAIRRRGGRNSAKDPRHKPPTISFRQYAASAIGARREAAVPTRTLPQNDGGGRETGRGC